MSADALKRDMNRASGVRWAANMTSAQLSTDHARMVMVAGTCRGLINHGVFVGPGFEAQKMGWLAAAAAAAGVVMLSPVAAQHDQVLGVMQPVMPQVPAVADAIDPMVSASVEARLDELRNAAVEEGIAWNIVAEAQLRDFLTQLSSPARPAIAVDDNGDLRILWENMLREQVGIRFKGQPELEAVLFQKTEHGVRREILKAESAAVISLMKEMKLMHVTRG